MGRIELIKKLMNEHHHSPEALLLSLVSTMSNGDLFCAMEVVSRIEDWETKVYYDGVKGETKLVSCEEECNEQV
jgi:hypothetical protein